MSGKRVLAVLTRSAAACQVKREHLCAAMGGFDEAERSERGGGCGWGAEGRSEPFQGSHVIVRW